MFWFPGHSNSRTYKEIKGTVSPWSINQKFGSMHPINRIIYSLQIITRIGIIYYVKYS